MALTPTDLVRLLGLHVFHTPPVASTSAISYVMTELAADNFLVSARLSYDSLLVQRLSTLLAQSAALLTPTAPILAKLTLIEATLVSATVAGSDYDQPGSAVSGELGLTVFLLEALTGPINCWLYYLLKDTPLSSARWQVVGNGPPGKADIRLVLRDPKATGEPMTLVVGEIKTSIALSDTVMLSMCDDIARHRLYSSADGTTVCVGEEHLARGQRSKLCKVIDQIRIEMASRGVDVAMCTNGTLFVPIVQTHSRTKPVVTFGDPIRQTDERLSSSTLATTPLGLVLALVFEGFRLKGINIERSPDERPTDDHDGARRSDSLPFAAPPTSMRTSTSLAANSLPTPQLTPAASPTKITLPPTILLQFPRRTRPMQRIFPAVTSSSHRSANVMQGGLRGSGALATCFSGTVNHVNSYNVLLKFVDITSFPEEGAWNGHTRDEALSAIYKEATLLAGPLAGVAGVPRMMGMYSAPDSDGGGGQVICLVEEDCGQRLTMSARADLSKQQSIRDLYTTIHAAGVLHGDVEWRHILDGGPGGVAIIDFDKATGRSDETDKQWAALCEEEMKKVQAMLETS